MNNKGFTLIEAIVSISIFIVVAFSIAQFIMIAIQNQIKVYTTQGLLNQTSYTLDIMSKSLRMAKKDIVGNCTGEVGKNYLVDGSSISFLAYDALEGVYKCKKFFLEDSTIKQAISTDTTSANFGDSSNLTAGYIDVSDLGFSVSGDTDFNELQARVTITMKATNDSIEGGLDVQTQTTITLRRLDI